MVSLADMRNGLRQPDDDDVTPGEASDAFEDAAESVRQTSNTPSRNSSIKIGSEPAVGLGINGHAEGGTSKVENKEDQPKMSARLSRWISDDPAMFAGEASPPLNAPSHSRQVTAEKVPSTAEQPAAAQQEQIARPNSWELPSDPAAASEVLHVVRNKEEEVNGDDDNQTPVLPSHSRQNTAEAAPSLIAQSTPQEASPGPSHSRQVTAETAPALVASTGGQESEDKERRSRSPSRQVTAEMQSGTADGGTVQNEEAGVSLSNIRSSLQSHSRQATAEDVPVLAPPEMESDRERSVSPTKMMVPGLSGDVSLQSPPPPSSLGRIQALEQRNIGERQAPSTSPTPPGGLMRTASTRMGQFLGRMGSMRKPARSPPARQEGRFGMDRRNTGASMASMKSNAGESLATISDTHEGDGPRPSLQDQFRNLRKQEENGFSGMNGHVENGDDWDPSTARSASDAAIIETVSGNDTPEARSHRASSSTPSIVKSPPMNPSLPPGTASGLTAGPAEEPRPVDWDLWQAVVYEGPSAVQRTSGEDLNRAISSGIPSPIRGVVWQVMAESKNAELENVYKTLKCRGSAAESESLAVDGSRPESLSRKPSQDNVNESAEKEDSDKSSSRASVHSVQSTPATSNLASPPLSVKGDEQELKLKLFAEKQKREAAALTKLEKAIRRDLGSRTSFSKFTQASGLQDGLFGVCKAYALFDEGVGYAQGINFIAMPLLFNMTEEEAFTLLVRLMSKYDLRSMFTGDMAGLHLRLYQFERLLEDQDPALYCHLRRRNVSPELYATQWFLTLFAYRFPLQLVVRVYDLLFSEGLTAILKFGLVLMQHNRDALLRMKDMAQLTNFLKEKVFDVYIDKSPSASSLLDSGFFGSVTGGADKELYRADEMVRDACEIQISEAVLAQYTAEWEESQRLTHEREVELETLRTTNSALTVKIRGLEERTQLQDNEHVNIAGDLVRIKVENDTLMDENEGMKMKVEELQKMVDAQPAEVEARLKEEMDRILQRNSEVQSENRVLKEEMEEMEHELVNVKMLHAQTQSDYDALIQKWSSIQSMLSDK
ncbi:uncharacterized protein LTR77_000508 [Saxophila tyrrhenica]|uniref:GTPase-activating protein GYP5 n=1 Tax=Saxophila tyrrhenica TaxID=1690608 RepID=A0AAV9PMU7_9PEZI|nr:hypothetical protein LTR77_000508 [Saxophila tyrrhenica]